MLTYSLSQGVLVGREASSGRSSRQRARASLTSMQSVRPVRLGKPIIEAWSRWAGQRRYSEAEALPQRLTLVAALGRSSPDASGPAQLPGSISQLRAGLAYETSKGFCNSTGRQLFSEFAAQRFKNLQQDAKNFNERALFQRLCAGFQKYATLDIQQRSRLVSEAIAAISIPTAPLTAASLSPGATSSPGTSHSTNGTVSTQLQQTLERISSSESARTSYASGGENSSSGVTHAVTRQSAQGKHAVDGRAREFDREDTSPPAFPQRQTHGEGALQGTSPARESSNCAGLPLTDDVMLLEENGGELPGGLEGVAESTAGIPVMDEVTLPTEEGGGYLGKVAEPVSGISQSMDEAQGAVGSMPLVAEEDDLLISGTLRESREEDAESPALSEELDDVDSRRPGGAIETILEAEEGGEGLSDAQQFRESFQRAAAIAANGLSREAREAEMKVGAQRTDAWHELRDSRLTASAFGNALGFWEDGRLALWEEKLGLREKFRGNEATQWGTVREDDALERYVELTGHIVESRSFQMLRDDDVHGWLGASPDGLIEGLPGLRPAGHLQVLEGSGAGVLEIKCPYNRGDPFSAKPYHSAPWYYMAQVQGLMEIFDREWCNAFSYTVNGAAVYHIKRDRRYWADVFEVLADFWWAHLIPAKHALAAGLPEEARLFEPPAVHPRTEELKERSKQMAKAATSIIYPPPPLSTTDLHPAGRTARPRARVATG